MSARILVNDDETAIVQALKTLLAREGYQVETTGRCEDALAAIADHHIDVLISDIVMEPMDGLELLRQVRILQPHLKVIMITGAGSVDSAVTAMVHGAFDYICKPFRIADLVATVQRALSSGAAVDVKAGGAVEVRVHPGDLVGESPAMHSLYRLIEPLAATDETVLVLSDEGCEREAVARALHHGSHRADQPFAAISCSQYDAAELKKILLGSEGKQDKLTEQSFFFRCGGGTAFLDDIHVLPTALQDKLIPHLRKLTPFLPPGSPRKEELDVRLLLGSRELLTDSVHAGRIQPELCKLVNPLTITLPPLTQRLADLPVLVRHYLNFYESRHGARLTISGSALQALEQHFWPENTRELAAVVLRAAARCDGGTVKVKDLPDHLQPMTDGDAEEGVAPSAESHLRWRFLHDFLAGHESQWTESFLRRLKGDHQRAAEMLGISIEEWKRKLLNVGRRI